MKLECSRYTKWRWTAIALLLTVPVSSWGASIAELREQLAAKQAELAKAKNSRVLLQSFSANYTARSQRLAADRTQLEAVRQKIVTIQQNNLIKVTLQLGVETAKTMKDACDVGQAATTGVRALAEELLANTLKDEQKKAMGLDTETLTSPLTVRITGLNALATKKVPEIEAVQKILRSDLSTIRGQTWNDRVADPHYDVTAPGNDPRYWSDNAVILVKLESVKEALNVAKTALQGISDELDATNIDTTNKLPDAVLQEQQLSDDVFFTQAELNDAINAEIIAARDAAVDAKLNELPNPVPEPPPYVAPKTEEETPEQFEQRRILTVIGEANAHVAPLMSQIDTKMQDYNDSVAEYSAITELWGPGASENTNHLGWLQTYAEVVREEGESDLSAYPTPALVAAAFRDLKEHLAKLNARLGAPATASGILSQMQSRWQQANELRVQVSEWVAMAAAQGVTVSYYGYDTPQEGNYVESQIASLEDFNSTLPDSVSVGEARLLALRSRFSELISALVQEVSSAGDRMQQAEVALAQYAAAAAAADQYLLQSTWSQTFDITPGEYDGTNGYYFWGSAGRVMRPLTRRMFWMRPLMGEMCVALAQPGDQGIIAFQQVLNKYGAFLTGFTTVNDRYHAKYVALRQAVEEIVGDGYAGVPPALSVIQAANGISPELAPPSSIAFAGSDILSPSGSIEIGDRILELNSSLATHYGLGTAAWLEEPSLDVPGFPFDTHSPAATLLAIKTRALREIPTWSSLYFSDWKAKRDAWLTEINGWHTLFVLPSSFSGLYGMDAAWRAQFLQPAEDQARADAQTLFARYPHIVDPPTIAVMRPDTVLQKLFPDTPPEELRVVSFSEGLSFQWYRRLNGGMWSPISRATLPYYQAAYAEGVQEFYCRIWNRSGSCLSDIRTILGIRTPRMVKEPSPALISARTGSTVVLTCTLDDTPAGGTKNSQWYKAKLDAAGRPIMIPNPFGGGELYDMEFLNSNPRMSGLQTTTLTITNFQPEDAGAYFIHVSNEYSYCQSDIARVKHVNTDVAPVFLSQPQSQEAMQGGSASFRVVVNGSPSPQYQWKRNGTPLTDLMGSVSGATTPTLLMENLQPAQTGNITCTVTCGSKKGTSAIALLTVKSPEAPVIATPPTSATADPGAVVNFSVVAKGGFPTHYTYQWQFKSADTWSDMAGLTTATISIIGITTEDAGDYRCVVGNGAAGANLRTTTSPLATLTLNGLPRITADPDDVTAQYGATASFTAAATGIPAPTMQWYRIVDGGEAEALAGQTRATLNLTLTGEPWASGTSFQVFLRAKNRFGATDSALAVLTLEDPFDSPAGVGRYLGLVSPSATLNNSLGGSIDLKLTKVGTFTGQLNMAGKLYAFKGGCDEQGTSSVTVLRKGLLPLVARLTFDGTGTLTGQLWQLGDRLPQDIITGHQLPWVAKTNPATAYAASYTAALLPPSDASTDEPLGTSWLKFKIATTGTCTGSGRLADGTSVTLSSVVWPDGSLPLFVSVYTRAGSILGTVDCASTPVSGTLRWRKIPATPPAGKNYANGIGPMNLTITGGRYTAPARNQYVLGLTAVQVGSLSLAAEEGGLVSSTSFPFTLSTSNIATFNISTRQFLPKLALNATAGTMSGSFYVFDTQMVGGKPVTTRRTAAYTGILLSRSGTAPAAMLGYFLLPGLNNGPILSGPVEVIIP